MYPNTHSESTQPKTFQDILENRSLNTWTNELMAHLKQFMENGKLYNDIFCELYMNYLLSISTESLNQKLARLTEELKVKETFFQKFRFGEMGYQPSQSDIQAYEKNLEKQQEMLREESERIFYELEYLDRYSDAISKTKENIAHSKQQLEETKQRFHQFIKEYLTVVETGGFKDDAEFTTLQEMKEGIKEIESWRTFASSLDTKLKAELHTDWQMFETYYGPYCAKGANREKHQAEAKIDDARKTDSNNGIIGKSLPFNTPKSHAGTFSVNAIRYFTDCIKEKNFLINVSMSELRQQLINTHSALSGAMTIRQQILGYNQDNRSDLNKSQQGFFASSLIDAINTVHDKNNALKAIEKNSTTDLINVSNYINYILKLLTEGRKLIAEIKKLSVTENDRADVEKLTSNMQSSLVLGEIEIVNIFHLLNQNISNNNKDELTDLTPEMTQFNQEYINVYMSGKHAEAMQQVVKQYISLMSGEVQKVSKRECN